MRLLAQAGDDRSQCETHAAWWVIFLIVLFVLFLIILSIVIIVLCVFHFIGNMLENELQKKGTCS